MQICSNVLNSKISNPEGKGFNLNGGKRIEIFQTSDVQDPNEVGLLHGGVDERSVAEINKPGKHPVVGGPCQGSNSVEALVYE